jgi:hypothetical protein
MASARAQTRKTGLLGILSAFQGRSSGRFTVPNGFRPVPDPASVHELDPQPVESLSVALEKVEEESLLQLVAPEEAP